MKIPQKPPIGLRPANIWLYERIQEINHAIARYTEAHSELPAHWIEERNDLLKKESEINRKEDTAERLAKIMKDSRESFLDKMQNNHFHWADNFLSKEDVLKKYGLNIHSGFYKKDERSVSEKEFFEALKKTTGFDPISKDEILNYSVDVAQTGKDKSVISVLSKNELNEKTERREKMVSELVKDSRLEIDFEGGEFKVSFIGENIKKSLKDWLLNG